MAKTPVMDKTNVAEPAKAVQISAPEIQTSNASINIAAQVQQGVNKGFEHFKSFQTAATALAIKKQELAFNELSWKYREAAASVLNDIELGRLDFDDAKQSILEADKRFTDSAQNDYSGEFTAKWRQSQDAMKTIATSESALGKAYLKDQNARQLFYANNEGNRYANLAVTNDDRNFIDVEFRQFLETKTLFGKKQIDELTYNFNRQYDLGKVLKDINYDPQTTAAKLKSDLDYLPYLQPNERQKFYHAAIAADNNAKASGRKSDNPMFDYAVYNLIDDRNNQPLMQNMFAAAINDKKKFNNLFDGLKGLYGFQEGKTVPEQEAVMKKKMFNDLISAQEKLEKMPTVENAAEFVKTSQNLQQFNKALFDMAGDDYTATTPLSSSSLEKFKANLTSNYAQFVALDAQLTNGNNSAYQTVIGSSKFNHDTQGINSARQTFYNLLRRDNISLFNNVQTINDKKIKHQTPEEKQEKQEYDILQNLKKTAGGAAAVYLVKLNEPTEISNHPNVNYRNQLKFNVLYSYYLDQIYKIAASNGIDINAKDIQSKTAIENITYQVFRQMHINEFANTPFEPAGRVDLKNNLILGGDKAQAGYKNIAVKSKNWLGDIK